MIYLYKKTHNKTGLNYLGKTKSPDPHKYPGSGVYWSRHLAKHGNDVTTVILKECNTEEELIKWGLYYSRLWNVVEDKNWANLTEEAGPGGAWSLESKLKLSNTNKQLWSGLTKEEQIARMKNSACNPTSYTDKRKENISKATLGKKKTVTTKLLQAQENSRRRIQSDPLRCGDHNRGKTWKLINGKRVWIEMEKTDY